MPDVGFALPGPGSPGAGVLDLPVYDPVAVARAGFVREPIDPTLDLFEEIDRLKRETNAVVLAHYYQEPDIQDVADVIGDSLGLAREAAKTDADVIVFAGVHFMAETAKILNPGKTVLLPDLHAGCSLADSCPPDAFAAFRAAHPDHIVVSYINCSAAIKAQTDIIVTSSNAEHIVRQIPEGQPVIFAPDRNLGRWLNQQTGREMLLWDGSCIVHEIFSEQKLTRLKIRHPNALVLAHPECEAPVLRHADHVGSTASIRRFAKESPATEFIVATESGILHSMQKDNPSKVFIPAPPDNGCACNDCPHMKLNTLEKLYLCLKHRAPELVMDEGLRVAALRPIERMLEMSAGVQ
jgi:quinolinate synthase